MRFKVSKKIFVHIDCDSFFASCEILKNPNLRWKYVCVGEEIVVACTYNAKKLWIKCGTPIWEAKNILWEKWIFFGVDGSYYQVISDRLMEYLKENTLDIEQFSIDEAFCEITWIPEMKKISLEKFVKDLQKDILKKIWIPVSIWVSNTRIKAKIFSKINKPFWIFISFTKEDDKEIFEKLPLKIIPFIWKSCQEKLKYKTKTVYDFLKIWYWDLKKIIWKTATDLWLELSWINALCFKRNSQIKSMSRWRSFNKIKTNNREFLYKNLLINFELLYKDFITKNLELKTISIFLRDKDFVTHIYKLKIEEYTYVRSKIFSVIKYLFDQNITDNTIYRSTWVIFSDFRSYKPFQLSIFDRPLRDKNNFLELSKVVNRINDKYWDKKINYWF